MHDGKPITDTLGEIENGQFLRDLTRELRKITNAVSDTRKVGKLTISLEIKPTGRATVEIAAKYDAKAPEHDRPTTVFFLTDGGTLLRDDPTQERLPFREVPRDDQTEARRIGD